MNTLIDLNDLNINQLEKAMMLGEGMTTQPKILDVVNQDVLNFELVIDYKGVVSTLATRVRYNVIIRDEMEEEGQLEATVYISVSRVGIVGQF